MGKLTTQQLDKISILSETQMDAEYAWRTGKISYKKYLKATEVSTDQINSIIADAYPNWEGHYKCQCGIYHPSNDDEEYYNGEGK